VTGQSVFLGQEEKKMINELIKLSTHLDDKGYYKEADYLDYLIYKESQFVNPVTWWKEKGLTEGLTEFSEESADLREDFLDYSQFALDAIGIVPGAGELFDVASATISALRKKPVNTVLSIISTIPLIGDTVGKGTKILLYAISKGWKTIKFGLKTFRVKNLAQFLLDKITPQSAKIQSVLGDTDKKKAGTSEFSDLWLKNILPNIEAAARTA
jgi:hypothetical protein